MLPKPRQAIAYQVLALSMAALVIFGISRFYPVDDLVRSLHRYVDRYQPWSTVVYPFIHAACNLLLLPAGALVIGSGFLFGLWQGFLLALTGHLLGATGAFWISRTVGRGLVERYLASRPQWRALDAAIEREGWKIVFLSQLCPLFPTSLFNYCYGLTRLRFWPCMAWIALGWSPGMFLYAYLGRMGRFGWRIWQEGSRPTVAQCAVWFGGLALSLTATFVLGSLAIRLLREARARAEAGRAQPAEPAAKSVR